MKICKMLKKKDVGSIGIGAMIVFIAMVLVAGIAASVLIQTSTKLETQAMATGSQTTQEVASGICVFDVLGYTASSSVDISKIIIGVRPRAGAGGVDLSQAYVELSDTTKKVILNYTTSYYSEPVGLDDVFNAGVYPSDANSSASQFGILVVEDADNSLSMATPVINRGDKAYICVNVGSCFGTIPERTDIWGMVVGELGSPGIIAFQTPASYTDNVMDLQ